MATTILFYNENTGYRLPDNILVTFYAFADTNLTNPIALAYTLDSAVQVNFNGGDFIMTFYGADLLFNNLLLYVDLAVNQTTAVVNIPTPTTNTPSTSANTLVGPQGASGFFIPPYLLQSFQVGQYITNNYQLLTLNDISPFVVGNYILLSNKITRLNGVFQILQTSGVVNLPNLMQITLQNNQILVSAIDLTVGYGCSNGSVFDANTTLVSFGASALAQNINNLQGLTLNNPKQFDTLVYKNGSFVNTPQSAYELSDFWNGIIPAGTTIFRFVFLRNVNMLGGLGRAGTAPFQTAIFSITKNGTEVAQLFFYPNGTSNCSLTGSASVNYANGDVMTIVAPESQDMTLADICFTLTGYTF